MIPKRIFYVWFGSDKPAQVQNCINNWYKKLDGYEIIEVNDISPYFNLEYEYNNCKWFKTVYDRKMWAYVSDYVRCKVLYDYGGVYLDTDITIEKDILNLLKKDKLILGWEDSDTIANGIMIAPSNNKIIEKMLNFYVEQIWHSELYTIPQITTYILKNNFCIESSNIITENNDILVFPTEYFYPMPFGAITKDKFVTDDTYTIHWWGASWIKPEILYFLENKHKMTIEDIDSTYKQNKTKIDMYYRVKNAWGQKKLECEIGKC